jgi:hypothetical protein
MSWTILRKNSSSKTLKFGKMLKKKIAGLFKGEPVAIIK